MPQLRWKSAQLTVLAWILAVAAEDSDGNAGLDSASTDISYASDPILQYRPHFARSLPVQILMTGIILTLVAVLFIHLLFTAQYHWPLAKVNYVLQLSGVSTLLISLIATLHVVLDKSVQESLQWPYMLSYIAVNIPPLNGLEDGWTFTERALWLLMNATTSGLIQITHIQFLTLLYPSRLEGRLIFFLLAPLAIVAAVMQLLPISGNPSVTTVSSAIKNVCNATLSLLFTLALLLWGLLVNRAAAWRTDGGTFAFGAGAIFLALVSTGLNFLYIPSQEEYIWLPGLMWAVVLWQSFLGWWWWVGGGMGVGEVEELMRREEKKERKQRERRQRRKEQREKAKLVWRGMTGAFQKGKRASDSSDEEILVEIDDSNEQNQEIEPDTDTQSVSPTAATTTTTSANTHPILQTRLGLLFQKWYLLLRQAHLIAARKQAVDRVERINAVYGREGGTTARDEDGDGAGVVGWGLGSFGIREREREREQARAAGSGDEDGEGGQRVELENKGTAGGKWAGAPVPVGRNSMWWWGPLQRWRLKDSTAYS
ncbi:hypothetical protein PLICRDRAFT_34528 [Plicaturopsis crispa FD-325 SS-3]|nr:hypothetical protein PLICRDRAFT_34528 [Plicaturopsis crispa FD-325 SS-3]